MMCTVVYVRNSKIGVLKCEFEKLKSSVNSLKSNGARIKHIYDDKNEAIDITKI